ncbi:MAG: molybdenum cofactor synthesis domain protein [Planctomycetaceae bacterium]|nr:molybdenum cofactor synthesis domain protein [Planctomycetaceae bacterium]
MSASESASPNSDVRMRGFAQRATVEEATAWIDSAVPAFESLPTTQVSLQDAAGRVLAVDIVSRVNVPAFARSMMDGFAVRGEETYGATPYNPLSLRIRGTCLPGTSFSGELAAGEVLRIMTGAPLPTGTDAVLPVEQSESDGLQVLVMGEVSAGKHVGQVGEDIRAGECILTAGRHLRPQDLGVLSSIGVSQVSVIRRPRVRILITGNELLPAGTPPEGYRIADANGPMLGALVLRDGGEAPTCDMIPDAPESIREALLSPADIILVSGGSSVGVEDHAPRLLAEEGELAVHGIAMRPSSPAGMGRLSNRLVFLLPGNPVSCLCAYDFFAGRAIRALSGRSTDWPYRQMRGVLVRKLVSTVGRVDYARVQIRGSEVDPLAISGASILSSTTRADGFVIVPADSEGYPPGAEVDVYLYG